LTVCATRIQGAIIAGSTASLRNDGDGLVDAITRLL